MSCKITNRAECRLTKCQGERIPNKGHLHRLNSNAEFWPLHGSAKADSSVFELMSYGAYISVRVR